MALVPFSYLNYQVDGNAESDENKKFYFYVDDKTISIEQFTAKGIGGLLWDCVRYLLNSLVNNGN